MNPDSLFYDMQFGLTPDKIGLVFLANAVPYAACAPLSGLLADKIVSQYGAKFNLLTILALKFIHSYA